MAAGLLLLRLLLLLLLTFAHGRMGCLPGLLTRAAAFTAFCSCMAVEKVWLTARPPTDWAERDSWPGLCTCRTVEDKQLDPEMKEMEICMFFD